MQGILTSEIRSRIEQILRSPNSIDSDSFHEVATAYADLVIQINRRVAICNQWIDDGLRSEAIHMASLTPDLLQAVGQLDLGDSLEAWTVLCEANNAPVPPIADWELAAYLNESWELENKLKLKLQDLRRSMLQHDSIKSRIQLLRTLCKHDQDNPIWQLTISEHEVKRVEELQDELDVAIEKNDLKTIGNIKSELLSADWIEPPPIELIELSITAKKSIKKTHTTIQFKRVARKLFKAMSEGNEKKARDLTSKWESSIAGGLTAPQSAIEDAIPVFEWLDKLSAQEEAKAEFENLCDQLMQALDNQTPIEELETICNKLERMDFGIPSILENRYIHRCESFNRSAKRKNLLKIIVGAFAIFAIVTVVLILNQRADKINKIISFQDDLITAIESQNIPIIERMLGTTDPSILSEKDGMLISEWESAEQLILEDISRREKFSNLLGKLGALSPIDIPNLSLDQLDELARTQIEQDKATNLRESSRSEKIKHDESIRSKITMTLSEVTDELEKLQGQLNNGSLPKNWKEFNDNIRDLEQKTVAVGKQIGKLFFPSTRQEGLLKTLNNGIQNLSIEATTNRLNSEQITETIKSLHRNHTLIVHMQYINSLAKYDTYQYREDIENIKQSESAVTAIDKWNSVWEDLPPELSSLHHDVSKTKRILLAINGLGTEHPENKSIEKLKQYLDSIVRMDNPENSPKYKLSKFLGTEGDSVPSWANKNLKRLVTEDGNYYGFNIKKITHRIEGSRAWLLQNCIITTDDYEWNNSSDFELLSSKISESARIEPTGFRQWKTRVASKNLLSYHPSVATDLWYLNLLLELARIEDFEPMVRYALTSRIANLHQSTVWHTFNDFDSIARDNNYNPKDTWFNPNDFKAERALKTRILEKFDEDSIRDLIQKSKRAFSDLVIPNQYIFIGHASKSKTQSGLTIAVLNVESSLLNNKQTVFALKGAGTAWSFVEVGEIINQQIKLVPEYVSIKFGSPLFIANSKKEQQ